MNGHIIPGTCIAVDFWKIRGVQDQLIHFLTHLHGDHIVGLTSSWARPIYCSEFTANILHAHYGIPKSLMKILYVNQCVMIKIPSSSDTFSVTAYDANHCPGALMLYFEGPFGNIFYTGDFRFSKDMNEHLNNLSGNVDKLYLDNTFCSPYCVFPSREECQQRIIDIAKDHPDYDIIIGIRKLGKESMLGSLAVELNETIFVSPERYQISQCLFDTNVFAVASRDQNIRIKTLPIHSITRELVFLKNQITPTIAIMPTAIFTGLSCRPFCRDPHIFVVPYSDHSSFPELVGFVEVLQPKQIFPIVASKKGPFGKDISDRLNTALLQSYAKADKNYFQIPRPKPPVFVKDNRNSGLKGNCFNAKATNVSMTEKINGKKFLHLKSDLSACEDILVPNHSLKRKHSIPDKRKKKAAKGIVFQDDFMESPPNCKTVMVNDSDPKGTSEKVTSNSAICQKDDAIIKETRCDSEAVSSSNEDTRKSCHVSQQDVFENNNVSCSGSDNTDGDRPPFDMLKSTNLAKNEEHALSDTAALDGIIIENLEFLKREHGIDGNSLDEVSHNVIPKCGQSDGKELTCISEATTSMSLDQRKISQHEHSQSNGSKNIPISSNNRNEVDSNSTFNQNVTGKVEELSCDDNEFRHSKDSDRGSSAGRIDEERVPGSASFDDSVVENIIALGGNREDSMNRTVENQEIHGSGRSVHGVPHQEVVGRCHSRDQESSTSEEKTCSERNLHELRQSVVQGSNAKGLCILDDKTESSKRSKCSQKKVKVNKWAKLLKEKLLKQQCGSSNKLYNVTNNRRVCYKSMFEFSAIQLLQTGHLNKLNIFNNKEEFHSALADLM